MSYRIVDRRLGGSAITVAGPDIVCGFEVYADEAEQPCLTTYFGVSQRLALNLFPLTSGARTSLDEPRLARTLATYALPRIEAGLLDGAFAKFMDGQFVHILTPEEARRLAALLNEKQCRYLRHGDDDFCRAGYDSTKADTVPIGTTAHVCRLCDMPDSRIACSMLHHVTTWPKPGGIQPTGALCAAGKKENPNAGECRPGGNECWHRVVEPHAREDIVPLSPLTLHESIGYLDAVWRDAFQKKPLLSGNLLPAGGTLGTPCRSAEEFKEKVKALVDVFDAFDVPGSGGTLQRMITYLKAWSVAQGALPDDFAPVEKAINVLQQVTRLRANFEHSDARARSDFEQAQRALGIRLPAVSHTEEWDRLVAHVTDMLRVVREFLRKPHIARARSCPRRRVQRRQPPFTSRTGGALFVDFRVIDVLCESQLIFPIWFPERNHCEIALLAIAGVLRQVEHIGEERLSLAMTHGDPRPDQVN
jgi:hypothetical protein